MFSHNFKVNISNILKHKGRWTSYMLKTTSKIMTGDKDGLLYYTIFISSIYINFPVWYWADNPSTFSNTYWWQNINYFFTVSVYLSVSECNEIVFLKNAMDMYLGVISIYTKLRRLRFNIPIHSLLFTYTRHNLLVSGKVEHK